jgi:hypothetical protein
MPTVVGTPSHPQVLFVGFEDDDESYLAMRELVPNSLAVTDRNGLGAVRLEDWDVAVCRAAAPVLQVLPGWLHVFSYGEGVNTGAGVLAVDGGAAVYDYTGRQPGTAMTLTLDEPGVSASLKRLISRELVPWLSAQDVRRYLRRDTGFGSAAARVAATRRAEPTPGGAVLVADADGNPIAGQFTRTRESGARLSGVCLAVPFVPESPALWLSAAMEGWAELTPERFADLPQWRALPRWQTPEERRVVVALEALERERADAVAAWDQRERELEAELVVARAAAEAGRRRLVTESGEPLVAAVIEALELLGFGVVDADAELAPGQAKHEDLRVSDLGDPDWTNITEVKGHRGGGRANELYEMARHAATYLQRFDAEPVSRWYVCNQMRGDDPEGRPDLLPGADLMVESFAADGGLVLDTRDLFQLVRRVEEGELAAELAREMLRAQTGRFTL